MTYLPSDVHHGRAVCTSGHIQFMCDCTDGCAASTTYVECSVECERASKPQGIPLHVAKSFGLPWQWDVEADWPGGGTHTWNVRLNYEGRYEVRYLPHFGIPSKIFDSLELATAWIGGDR